MSFGAFCPMPLRLRDSGADGWSAAEFLRTTADLAAAERTVPFAVARVHRDSGATTATLLDYVGRHDESQEPTVSLGLSGELVVTWPDALRDGMGQDRPLRITHATAGVEGATANQWSVEVGPGNVVTLADTGGGELAATIVVHARWGNPVRIEDYGGDPDKRNAATEAVPYAYEWYQELGAALGSAYGQQTRGSVHARRLALSRALAAVSRADERYRCNTVPGTSDALLEDWRKCLAVPASSDDPRWLIRRRCAVKYAARGAASIPELQEQVYQLLGDRFLGIRTFDDPIPGEAWPSDYDLGSGVWASSRSRILVDVKAPADLHDREFSNLVNVHLVRLLDTLTPAWCVFDWTIPGDGFFLDISPLDFTGL